MTTDAPFDYRLSRTLTSASIWGFGFTGLLLWLLAAGDCIADIGPTNALLIWVPATLVGILTNLQVKRLGTHWPEMAGGTPNYTARLLAGRPWLARYTLMAYFQGWASVPTLSAIFLSNAIIAYFAKWGIAMPTLPLYALLTALSFSVAFSGTRTLAMLVLFFTIPAVGGLLLFVLNGLSWALNSPAAAPLVPAHGFDISLPNWAKWYMICTYAAYSCETASSFVADSLKPSKTLGILASITWLMPVVFIGGSLVLQSALPRGVMGGEDPFAYLLDAARPFWGEAAWLTGSFLIAAAALLSCATGAANSPRVLYQGALDGQLTEVFGVASRRAVPGPALVMTLITAMIFLFWQGYTSVFVVTSVGWFAAFILLRLGIWLNRGEAHALWPWLSLVLVVAETATFALGGITWGAGLFAAGLALPALLILADRWVSGLDAAPLRREWWVARYRRDEEAQKFPERISAMPVQFIGLLVLVLGATVLAWLVGVRQEGLIERVGLEIFGIVVLLIGFLIVSFAGWTLLPRFERLAETNLAMRQEVAQRQRAEEEARNLNARLETTVSERTALLERARANLEQSIGRLERQNREVTLRNEMGELLQSCISLDEAGAMIARFAPQLFEGASGAIYLATPGAETLTAVARWGAATPSEALMTADCWALRRGKTHLVTDADTSLLCPHVGGLSAGVASVCVPIAAHGEALGLLHMTCPDACEPGSTAMLEKQELAEALAAQTGMALANLRLRDVLHQQSVRDVLTGLYNRRYLESTLPREIGRAQRGNRPLAVFMLDVDHFKKFNDDYGHEAGDAVLRALGKALHDNCRQGDSACRFGGEEFTVLLPDTNLAQAREWGERLMGRVRAMEVKSGGTALPRIAISMGLALYPEHGSDTETLLQAADVALYDAKHTGRDRQMVYGENATAKAGA